MDGPIIRAKISMLTFCGVFLLRHTTERFEPFVLYMCTRVRTFCVHA